MADVCFEIWGLIGEPLTWSVVILAGTVLAMLVVDILRGSRPALSQADLDATACTLPADYDGAPEELIKAARELSTADTQELEPLDEWDEVRLLMLPERSSPIDEIDRIYLEMEIGPGR